MGYTFLLPNKMIMFTFNTLSQVNIVKQDNHDFI